jgi:HSP20 family protein
MADSKRHGLFEGFTDFVSEFNRMHTLGRTGRDPGHQEGEREFATAWVPPADIFARDDDLVIRLDLAGMHPDDIDISVDSGGMLTVSGERRTMTEAEEATYYVRERHHGAFRRTMSLPEGTPERAIDAYIDHGLVEIVVKGGASGASRRRIALEDRSGEGEHRSLRAREAR